MAIIHFIAFGGFSLIAGLGLLMRWLYWKRPLREACNTMMACLVLVMFFQRAIPLSLLAMITFYGRLFKTTRQRLRKAPHA